MLAYFTKIGENMWFNSAFIIPENQSNMSGHSPKKIPDSNITSSGYIEEKPIPVGFSQCSGFSPNN